MGNKLKTVSKAATILVEKSKEFCLQENSESIRKCISQKVEHLPEVQSEGSKILGNLVAKNDLAQSLQSVNTQRAPLSNINELIRDGVEKQTKTIFTQSKQKIGSFAGFLVTPIGFGMVGTSLVIGGGLYFGPKVFNFLKRKIEERDQRKTLKKYNLSLKDLDKVYSKSFGMRQALRKFLHCSFEKLCSYEEEDNTFYSVNEKFEMLYFTEYKKSFLKKIKTIKSIELKRNLNFIKLEVLNEIALKISKASIFATNYLDELFLAKEFLLKQAYYAEKNEKTVDLNDFSNDKSTFLPSVSTEINALSLQKSDVLRKTMTNLELEKQLFNRIDRLESGAYFFDKMKEFYYSPIFLQKQALLNEVAELSTALLEKFATEGDTPEVMAQKEFLKAQLKKIFELKGGSSDYDAVDEDDDPGDDDASDDDASDDDTSDDNPKEPLPPAKPTNREILDRFKLKIEKDWKWDAIKSLIDKFQDALITLPVPFDVFECPFTLSEVDLNFPLMQQKDQLLEDFRLLLGSEATSEMTKKDENEQREKFDIVRRKLDMQNYRFKSERTEFIDASQKRFEKHVGPQIEQLLSIIEQFAQSEYEKQLILAKEHSEKGEKIVYDFLKEREDDLLDFLVKLENTKTLFKKILQDSPNSGLYFMQQSNFPPEPPRE
jgi:hypothetical protein